MSLEPEDYKAPRCPNSTDFLYPDDIAFVS